MYIHGDLHENPRKGETSKKVINKGFLRVLEGYEQSDKYYSCATARECRCGAERALWGKSRQNAAVRHKSTTVLLRSTIVV